MSWWDDDAQDLNEVLGLELPDHRDPTEAETSKRKRDSESITISIEIPGSFVPLLSCLKKGIEQQPFCNKVSYAALQVLLEEEQRHSILPFPPSDLEAYLKDAKAAGMPLDLEYGRTGNIVVIHAVSAVRSLQSGSKRIKGPDGLAERILQVIDHDDTILSKKIIVAILGLLRNPNSAVKADAVAAEVGKGTKQLEHLVKYMHTELDYPIEWEDEKLSPHRPAGIKCAGDMVRKQQALNEMVSDFKTYLSVIKENAYRGIRVHSFGQFLWQHYPDIFVLCRSLNPRQIVNDAQQCRLPIETNGIFVCLK